ncbi:MAG: hypothetical protein K2N74_03870, partial [Clostridiales bacterium]|nr:hypothetical protein [Clostridiales bacterium]
MRTNREKIKEKGVEFVPNGHRLSVAAKYRRTHKLCLAGVLLCFFCLLAAMFGSFFSLAPREVITASADAASDWNSAVAAATEAAPKTVTLSADWNATANNANGFGTNTTYYKNGALYVPAGKSIILDLNGHALNRNLSSTLANGYAIYVEGTLTIRDSSAGKTGTIKGGFTNTSNTTGGIYVASGSVRMEGGTLTGNKSSTTYCGNAVYLYGANSTFTLAGGNIKSNPVSGTRNYTAGAAYLYGANSSFVLESGTISGNTGAGTWATGVAFLNGSGSSFIVKGGTISGNSATGATSAGVVTLNAANTRFNVQGGTISGNSSNNGAGVAYVNNTSGGFVMSNGSVTGNTGTLAGAVYLAGANSTFSMSGGSITSNTGTTGGALYMGGSSNTATLTGGVI